MSSHELIDVFDAGMNFVGVASKEDAHSSGLFHKSFHCWILTEKGRVLLQKRSSVKKVFPGLFDVSAAGHYRAGEDGKDGAREVKEELGFYPDCLVEMGIFLDEYKNDCHHNCEFCCVYAYFCDIPLNEYTLNEEADGLAYVDLSDLIKLFDGRVTAAEAEYFDKAENKIKKIVIAKSDFVPSESGYYSYILKKIVRLFDAEQEMCG